MAIDASQLHDSKLAEPNPIHERTLTGNTASNLDMSDPHASVDNIERVMHSSNPRSSTQMLASDDKVDIVDSVGPQILLAFIEQKAPYLTLDGIYKFVKKWAGTDSLKGDVNQLLHSYDFTTQPFQLKTGGIAFKLPLGTDTPIETSSFPDEPFRLMDLPLRIRLKIYSYTLGMPTTHGWIIDPYYTANASQHYKAALQNPNLPPLCLRTLAVPRWSLFSRPLQEVLSLISTSKEIYNEAMPIFYGSNTFRFDSCATLYGFLSGLPTRRPFIKNVILTYDPSFYDHSCDKAFHLLAQTNLKRLRMTLNEAHVMNLGNGCNNVARMPGFYTLERMRGLYELSFAGNFQRSKKFLRNMLKPRVGAGPELEEVLEKEHGVVLAQRRLDLKEEVKRLRREAKETVREREKAKRQAEKEEERERKKAERAEKKARSEELLDAEKRRHKAEVLQKRADKQMEKKRERTAKEETRLNKQWALAEKERLATQAKGLMKRQQEEDEEEAMVGPSRKRGKMAASVSRGSSVPGRGRGRGHITSGGVIQSVARGRGGRGRGSTARLPVQKSIKTVSGSSRNAIKEPFIEQSSSDDESIDDPQAQDEVDDTNIDPRLLEIDRLNAERQAREESTESEAE